MEIGCNTSGSRAIAGDLFAVACVLPTGTENSKISAETLVRDDRFKYAIGVVDARCIDILGIHSATQIVMKKAVLILCSQNSITEDCRIVVENKYKRTLSDVHIPGCTFAFDSSKKCTEIAAAVARLFRNQKMTDLDVKYPGWGFADHKGYRTASHMETLKRRLPHITPIHRTSFPPLKILLSR